MRPHWNFCNFGKISGVCRVSVGCLSGKHTDYILTLGGIMIV
nr:MAG TPA: hypothetical protein [Caudoviricetes sp.]